MINAPSAITAALKSDNFSYANLVTINLGDVYGIGGSGEDTGNLLIETLTDHNIGATASLPLIPELTSANIRVQGYCAFDDYISIIQNNGVLSLNLEYSENGGAYQLIETIELEFDLTVINEYDVDNYGADPLHTGHRDISYAKTVFPTGGNVVFRLTVNGDTQYVDGVSLTFSVNVYGASDISTSEDDYILYLTDHGHPITHGGNTYTPDHNLTGIAGISRKASTGSDSVDIEFAATDPFLIDLIKTERYINKPTSIDRVVIVDGQVLDDYKIPIRTAWGLSHAIEGDVDDRTITLTIDSTLGDLNMDNGWYAINASHQQRYPSDFIMRHGATVMTDEQQKKYTTNFSGVINEDVKPPALPKIYGYKNVELIPICMLKHRKSHSTYRHYFTTFIYAVNIGECESVDLSSLSENDELARYTIVADNGFDYGGWSIRLRKPTENEVSVKVDPKLNFWREGMDNNEIQRLDEMYGKGLTLLFVKNRNRDDWISKPPELKVPVQGSRVYDPRTGLTVFSRNPALQYADYLRSPEYGAGRRGIPVSNTDVIALANHFDQIPDSVGNPGINSILIDVQVDTGKPLVENMNIWMEGTRLFTSDYYGEFRIRVETKSAPILTLDESELFDSPSYDSGAFTDRLNQLTYTINQLVPNTSDDALAGELVEVDVEATFPEDGSDTLSKWVAQDGGISNSDSEQLDYVTVLEQAFYWAMVDARISRMPAELELPVGPIGWLVEVGDVIDFSSEVMALENTTWRVDEVSEDDGVVTLKTKPYSDTFYTPDPNVIPDPAGVVVPPTARNLSPVSNLAIESVNGFLYLKWSPVTTENITWYAVEIEREGELIVDKPRVTEPPLLLENMQAGDYTAKVVTVSNKSESAAASLIFTLALPEAPTITTRVEAFEVEVSLSAPISSAGQAYELRFNTVDDVNSATVSGVGSSFTVVGLTPETTYYLYARTTNILGVSEWASVSVTTTAGQKYVDILDGSLDENQFTPSFNIRLDDFSGDISNANTEIAYNRVQLGDYAADAINALFTQANTNYITQEYIAEFDGFRAQINEDVGQILVEGGAVKAEEFTATQLLVDTHNGQISTLIQQQSTTDAALTINTSQIQQNANEIALLTTSLAGTDFNQLSIRLDQTENELTLSSISAASGNVNLINEIFNGANTAFDLAAQGVNLAAAETKITSLTNESTSQAQKLDVVVALSNQNQAQVVQNAQAITNETGARATQAALIEASVQDEASARTAAITQVNESIANETSARASQFNQLDASLTSEIATRSAAITQVNQAIANETSARVSQFNSLSTAITNESSTRSADITQVNQAITDETSARATQFNQLDAALSTESATRTAEITQANQAIVDEETARASQYTQLLASITVNGEDVNALTSRVNDVEVDLIGNISAVNGLTAEIDDPNTGLANAHVLISAQQTQINGKAEQSSLASLQAEIDDPATGLVNAYVKLTAQQNEIDGIKATATIGVDAAGVFTGIVVDGSTTATSISFQGDEIELLDGNGIPWVEFDSVANTAVVKGEGRFTKGLSTGYAVGPYSVAYLSIGKESGLLEAPDLLGVRIGYQTYAHDTTPASNNYIEFTDNGVDIHGGGRPDPIRIRNPARAYSDFHVAGDLTGPTITSLLNTIAALEQRITDLENA